jgi:hypothetical protein
MYRRCTSCRGEKTVTASARGRTGGSGGDVAGTTAREIIWKDRETPLKTSLTNLGSRKQRRYAETCSLGVDNYRILEV